MSNITETDPGPLGYRTRLALVRNRVIGSARFQRWATRTPFFRGIARRKAAAQFDLIAGFVYSQIANASVESGLIALLRAGPRSTASLVQALELSEQATDRLLRGAAALDLVESPQDGIWVLGEAGAALSANAGAMAMMRHHALLYRDLLDPMALLARPRTQGGALSRFWGDAYAGDASQTAAPYSALMAATQPLIWDQVLENYRFSRHRRMLDVGGGSGAFAQAVATETPALELGVFDLPAVAMLAKQRFAGTALEHRVAVHPGSFRTDPLPRGYDLITLVRILHDHDDEVARALLASIHDSLEPGGCLLIAEPMAGTAGAEKMGDAYFGMYLWALGSGRPRSFGEIRDMAKSAGFARVRDVSTPLPIVARIAVAHK